MKKLLGLFVFSFLFSSTQAQQKEFEGKVVYKTELTSKLPEVTAESLKRYHFMADTITFYFRKGFYREASPLLDVYYNPTEQQIYYHYKGIDSLFYLDYRYDSSNKILDVVALPQSGTIENFHCKKIEVTTERSTFTYDYAPDLYLNPIYDLNNTNEGYNVYVKVAKAVALKSTIDNEVYGSNRTAIHIEQKPLSDSVFTLPNLPKTKYQHASIVEPPKFKGDLKGYVKFLEKNLNNKLPNQYIKIPKGQQTAAVVVKLSFVVTEEGKVTGVRVRNKQEVHSILAAEAIRVTSMIPDLKPAKLNGKKIPYFFNNSITFVASL
jgi:hypothetical protein